MQPLPIPYQWIDNELAKFSGPKMLAEFRKIYGVREVQGRGDNPEILSWAKELNITDYTHDSIAWCGLTMATVCKRASKDMVKDPLWAANWLHFGTPVTMAMLGDVLVLSRVGGNHVAMYVGEDDIHYHLFGGNQGDAVGLMRMQKSSLRGIRRPIYTVQPSNVRKILLNIDGSLRHTD